MPLAFSITFFCSFMLALHLFMPPEVKVEKTSGIKIQHRLQHRSYALLVIQTTVYLYFICESPWLSPVFLLLSIKYPLLLLLTGCLIIEQIIARAGANIGLPRFIPQTYCIQIIKWFTLACFALPSMLTTVSHPNLYIMVYSLSAACVESSLGLLGMCIHDIYRKYRTDKSRQDLLDSCIQPTNTTPLPESKNQVTSNQFNLKPITHASPSSQQNKQRFWSHSTTRPTVHAKPMSRSSMKSIN